MRDQIRELADRDPAFAITAMQAMHACREAERTRARWSNPLSIYSPDPLRLAVVEFNAGLAERRRGHQRAADDLLARIAHFRAGLRGYGYVTARS